MINKNKLSILLALNIALFGGCSDKNIENQDNEYDVIKVKEETSVYDKDDIDRIHQKTFVFDDNPDITDEEIYNNYQKLKRINFAYVKEDSELYDSENLDSIAKIEKYQKVLIAEFGPEYSLVKLEDDNSYLINSDNIELLPDSFIEVDISSQTLNLYRDGEIVLTSPVVTGGNNHVTDLCYKSIFQKLRKTYLTGPTWRSYVDYWMAFNGGMGLHDASWRSEFGGNIYKRNGSHGCVNLPKHIAKELYENVEIGTMVLVKK